MKRAGAMNGRHSPRKFAVGDRVVYHPLRSGNTDLDGWKGVVVGVDHTGAPYTVRFDDAVPDMVTDTRFWQAGDRRGHDWWCMEEHLSRVRGRKPKQR